MAGQREETLERIKGLPRVLLVQDTMELNFTHHPATTGLGPVGNTSSRGFLAHTTLCVSQDGVPQGVLGQQVWSRPADGTGTRHQRHVREFSEKESYKWIDGLPEEAWAEQLPPAVVVCDAEAHIFALLAMIGNRDLDFVVRAARKRSVTVAGEDVFAQIARKPVRARYSLPLNRRPDRMAREAQVELRFAQMRLQRPRRTQVEEETLTVTVVEVKEIEPPAGEKGAHWVLLTSLPVKTVAQAQAVVHMYRQRWLVERFHYTLKSGCQMESSQLREVKRLERLLAVNTLVAWRLLWLTYQARITPDEPCTVALSEAEWKALWLKQMRHKPLPTSPPTLKQAVTWIAQLGGYLARKGDGPPGVVVLWRGWKRLVDLVDMWTLTQSRPSPKNVGNA
jgi:hypothetical protein